jgi:superfamily II DNA or RNA helicase
MSSTDSLMIDWETLAAEYAQRGHRLRLRDRRSSYHIHRPQTPALPDTLQLRDYQTQAIVRWLRHQGRGTLKMATGSGKRLWRWR